MLSFNWFLVGVALAASSCSSSENTSELEGSFETKFVADNFFLYEDVSDEWMKNFIERKNPSRDESVKTNAQLASEVGQVARCFGLDGRVFAGLVAQESAFKMNAVSNTGAAGLTQQTGIGIVEVNDQLGRRGKDYARAGAINYFQSAIKCSVSETPWKNLWERAPTTQAMKEILKSDSQTALIYGAVLLKTNLSAAKTHSANGTIESLYRDALRRYNGDPEQKEHYQAKIMKYAAEDFI